MFLGMCVCVCVCVTLSMLLSLKCCSLTCASLLLAYVAYDRLEDWSMGTKRSFNNYMEMVGLNTETKVATTNLWCHKGEWPEQVQWLFFHCCVYVACVLCVCVLLLLFSYFSALIDVWTRSVQHQEANSISTSCHITSRHCHTDLQGSMGMYEEYCSTIQ